MKPSLILSAPLIILAVLAIDGGNGYARGTFKTVNSDPKAVKNCKAHGGIKGKNSKGQDACITYSASKPSGCSQWIGDICVIWKH